MLADRPIYGEEHRQLRETARRFLATEVAPHFDRWERAGIVDRSMWVKGGEAGLLCPQVAEEYGDGGTSEIMRELISPKL